MKTRGKRNVFTKNIKYVLICCLLLIHFQPEYEIQCASLRNSSDLLFALQSTPKESTSLLLADPTHSKMVFVEHHSNTLVTVPHVILSIICVTLSSLFLGMILSYLSNQPLEKHGVLHCLYKDLIRLMLLLNIFWLIGSLFCYFTESGPTFTQLRAKVISFTIWVLALLLLLTMNIISGIRLHMIRTSTLDSPSPWGDDEDSAIRNIRCLCGILAIGFTSIMYGLGIYPKIYYQFRDYNPFHAPIPTATHIYCGLLMMLLATGLVTATLRRHFKLSSNNKNDAIVPHQLNVFIWIIMIGLAVLFFSGAYEILEITIRWEIFQIIIPMALVISPIVVILITNELKASARKSINHLLETMFFLSIYLVPSLLITVIYGSIYLFCPI